MFECEYKAEMNKALAIMSEALLEKFKNSGTDSEEQFGEIGQLVRLSDTVERLRNGFFNEEYNPENDWKEATAIALQCLILFYDMEDIDSINRLFEKAEKHPFNYEFPGGARFSFKPGLA